MTWQLCRGDFDKLLGRMVARRKASSSGQTNHYKIPSLARVRKVKFELIFLFWGPNPGPASLPLGSGRRDVEFAGVCASVASMADKKGQKVVASKTGIIRIDTGNLIKAADESTICGKSRR